MILESQRDRIDQIDLQLVQLFEERMKIVEEVIEVKIANKMEILDNQRENQVIQKAVNRLNNKELSSETQDFFNELMRISREYQGKIRNKNNEIK